MVMFMPMLFAALKAAAVGAAVGAGGAAVMGGDVKKGAMIGGVTGGVTGGATMIGGASTGMAGQVGTAASNFQQGLKSVVGIGTAPTTGAGAAGAKAGTSALSNAAMSGVSNYMTPAPQGPAGVTDYGSGPVPMARNQQPLADANARKSMTLNEAFKRGLV
jgi:hypothetical protein